MTTRQREVYTLLRNVPKGRVTTYKELSDAIGFKAYRLIGRYMKENPHPFMSCDDPDIQIPCHRVVRSDGSIGGFMGKTAGPEIDQKIALLQQEGIKLENGKIKEFTNILYSFSKQSSLSI